MSEEAVSLIKRDDKALAITFTPEAEALKVEAIESAAMIQKVDSIGSQELAVDAQKSCRRLIKLVRDAGKETRDPVNAFAKSIIKVENEFVATVEAEELRIAKLVGNYQQAELAKARSAEAARMAELTKMEKAREEALAEAPTIEAREAIRDEFSELTRVIQPPIAPAKVEGQSVREDWEIEITDIHELYRWHPHFVRLSPENAKKLEIREALNNGLTIRGITAKKVVKAGVRLERETKAIAV